MLILGLESSCDETAAALVTDHRRVLAHRLAGQEAAHAPYGGVVPEIAARAHAEALAPLIRAALDDAGVTLSDVDAIAATAGPGLIGGVMVGLVTGKALAHAANKPLVAVNHLEGHALSARLATPDLAFPYLLLLVSGGHCQLLLVEGVGRYRRLATTIDDAAGEAFDKTAKLLGLGYPGGPAVERAAVAGDAAAIAFPRPLVGSGEPHFSFAGLKSAVARVVGQASVPTLPQASSRRWSTAWSIARASPCPRQRGRRRWWWRAAWRPTLPSGPHCRTWRTATTLPFVAPPPVAVHRQCRHDRWAGVERFAAGLTDPLDTAARPRWPLDPTADAVRGAGVKA